MRACVLPSEKHFFLVLQLYKITPTATVFWSEIATYVVLLCMDVVQLTGAGALNISGSSQWAGF